MEVVEAVQVALPANPHDHIVLQGIFVPILELVQLSIELYSPNKFAEPQLMVTIK